MAPPPPPVILEDRVPPTATEAVPPPPPPPSVAAADEVTEVARDGHAAPSSVLYWNEWLEGDAHTRIPFVPEPAADSAPESEPTRVLIDLSVADLSLLDSANVTTTTPTGGFVTALLGETKIRVLPVVIGDALTLEPASAGWRPLRVNFTKMRTTSVQLPKTSSIDDPTFRSLARTASILGTTEWAPLTLEVRGAKKGCAGVALSVWDENLSRPLDQQFFPISVGGEPCARDKPGAPGLSNSLLRQYGSKPGDYEAALHVFEMTMPRTRRLIVSAVFVKKGDDHPYVWKLGRPLSSISEAMSADLGRARASHPYAFDKASLTLTTELFVRGDKEAKAAFDSLARFRDGPRRTIYARIVTQSGENLPLPLGLIDIGGVPLGSVATIATPFPLETAANPGAPCIDQRVILSDSPTFNGIAPRPAGAPLVGYSKTSEYLRSSPSGQSGRVTLVLLGHHGATEQILFDPTTPETPMTPGFMTRKFDHGVGFFMLCSVATAPRDLPTTWLETFGDHGIDGAIASPFEIQDKTAKLFLTAVQTVLANLPASSSISLAELYDEAIKRMDADRAYEAFEYVVVGDGSIRLCGEKS
jgi:hypothetical protein